MHVQILHLTGVYCLTDDSIGVIWQSFSDDTGFCQHGIDFLTTSLEYAYLSSSTVKEIASFGGDISACVPPAIRKLIEEKYEAAGGDAGM